MRLILEYLLSSVVQPTGYVQKALVQIESVVVIVGANLNSLFKSILFIKIINPNINKIEGLIFRYNKTI